MPYAPLMPYPLNRAVNALIPAVFVCMGLYFGVRTLLHILFIEKSPSLAFNYSHWRDASFANLWTFFGPIAAKSDIAVVPSIAGVAEGVVVDLGPGSGQNVRHFDRKKITQLFLVEPCQGLHPELNANLKKAELDDIATIIPCGVQDTPTLISHGLKPSSVNTVVTIKVLCSVPSQPQVCKSLYSLLKPGGQWLVYEHVVADPQYKLSRMLQNMYQIVWPTLMGGCNVNRDTARSLREAGAWEAFELGKGKGEVGWEMLGHVVGRLVKAKRRSE